MRSPDSWAMCKTCVQTRVYNEDKCFYLVSIILHIILISRIELISFSASIHWVKPNTLIFSLFNLLDNLMRKAPLNLLFCRWDKSDSGFLYRWWVIKWECVPGLLEYKFTFKKASYLFSIKREGSLYSLGSTLGCQAWEQALLLTEPSSQLGWGWGRITVEMSALWKQEVIQSEWRCCWGDCMCREGCFLSISFLQSDEWLWKTWTFFGSCVWRTV